MKQKIVIVDYKTGNLNSVKRKLYRLGIDAFVSSDLSLILNADKLVLPGVGHFGQAMENIKKLNLLDSLNEAVIIKKRPILGICLGMQLMSMSSEEGNSNGLGWFDAKIVRFQISDKLKFKIPHTGWNNILIRKESDLMKGINENDFFYFVHSYHAISNNQSQVLNTTIYEYEFVSAYQINNIFGVQYHPEKSHDSGDKLFRNFISL